MADNSSNASEVARLRHAIEEQLVAMRRGFSGPTIGTAHHAFIAARMKHIEIYQSELAGQIGPEAADKFFIDLYRQGMRTSETEPRDE